MKNSRIISILFAVFLFIGCAHNRPIVEINDDFRYPPVNSEKPKFLKLNTFIISPIHNNGDYLVSKYSNIDPQIFTYYELFGLGADFLFRRFGTIESALGPWIGAEFGWLNAGHGDAVFLFNTVTLGAFYKISIETFIQIYVGLGYSGAVASMIQNNGYYNMEKNASHGFSYITGVSVYPFKGFLSFLGASFFLKSSLWLPEIKGKDDDRAIRANSSRIIGFSFDWEL
ncbi:MAG: hypothetical protein LBV16_06390 [Elusimicrobiota bacterium]|jgi:hypothetical protein|nr:hypothetical protein [Elusimicrobiota bacterium]